MTASSLFFSKVESYSTHSDNRAWIQHSQPQGFPSLEGTLNVEHVSNPSHLVKLKHGLNLITGSGPVFLACCKIKFSPQDANSLFYKVLPFSKQLICYSNLQQRVTAQATWVLQNPRKFPCLKDGNRLTKRVKAAVHMALLSSLECGKVYCLA